MKTITNEIIDKFIEAGLINIKSIDHVRKLEVMRDEFNLMERERMIEFAKEFIDVVNIDDKDVEIIYNETYGGGEQ